MGPYITVALGLGIVCYRWNMPLTMRSAFYLLIGNLIYSPVGDIIDAVSIACTTFGVCTSLGLGVDQIVAYYAALQNKSYTALERIDAQTATIIVMTIVANISVVLGLHKGIQVLSTITFSLGLFVLIATLLLDNTWFLLNPVVQSTGHYLQWVLQIGFRTDSFEQLGIEFGNNNLLWGSNKASPNRTASGRVPSLDIMNNAAALRTDYNSSTMPFNYRTTFDAGPEWMMNWWTIFYWGWWVSWAPFVGMFIARISRGRTIRQIVVGALVAPTLFSFLWLGVWGSSASRCSVAELVLGDGTPNTDGSSSCSAWGYVDRAPTSAAAIALANDGYYAVLPQLPHARHHGALQGGQGIPLGSAPHRHHPLFHHLLRLWLLRRRRHLCQRLWPTPPSARRSSGAGPRALSLSHSFAGLRVRPERPRRRPGCFYRRGSALHCGHLLHVHLNLACSQD